MTRSPALAVRLLGSALLMILLAGCSATGLGRPKVLPGVRTTALIGDKPVAVVAGLPGESIEIDTRFPGRRDRPRQQISGRVVDSMGRPIPNAEIRLTDASGLDSREISAQADASGGFTVHDLHPRVRYRVSVHGSGVAGEGDLEGEAIAEAPDNTLRIALSTPSLARRADPSPRSELVSEKTPVPPDEPRPAPRSRLVSNDLDHLPPPREAESLPVEPLTPKTPPASAPRDVWKSAGSDTLDLGENPPTFSDSPPTDPVFPPTNSGSTPHQSPFGLPVEPDDGPDPLPPAIERDEPTPPAGQFDITPDPTHRPAPQPEPVSQLESADPPPGAFEPASESPSVAPDERSGSLSTSEPSSSPDDFLAAPSVPLPSSPEPEPAPDPQPEPSQGFESSSPHPSSPDIDAPPALDIPSSEPSAEPEPPSDPPASAEPEPSPAPTPEPEPDSPAAALPAPAFAPLEVPRSQPAPPLNAEKSPEPQEYQPPAPVESLDDNFDSLDAPGHPTGSFESPSSVSESGSPPSLTAQAPGTRRPTWSELTAQSAHKRASTYPPAQGQVENPPSGKRPGLGLLASLRNTGSKPAAEPISSQVVRASCNFNRAENRLVDFTLPDLQGRSVRFQDIDADYILLDFWGTWCGPCLRSIPHLVQLQNRYDPRRLRVIGVAYEQSDPSDNVRQVQQVMQQLGMNYPVLMGRQDGQPCPLQNALHVEAYPTLVLMDRHGRILWRESGSNPVTMARLNRVIASNTQSSAGILRR